MEFGKKIKSKLCDGTKVIYEITRITKLMVFCIIRNEDGKILDEKETQTYKSHFESWEKHQNEKFNW